MKYTVNYEEHHTTGHLAGRCYHKSFNTDDLDVCKEFIKKAESAINMPLVGLGTFRAKDVTVTDIETMKIVLKSNH